MRRNDQRQLLLLILGVVTLAFLFITFLVASRLAEAPTAPEETGAAGTRLCDDACTSNSQCAQLSPGGAELVCGSNGMCVNKICPTDTIPGNNCHCKTATQTCGQKCGSQYPLCTGGSTCRYIVGPSCAVGTQGVNQNNTYCIPNTLPTGYRLRKCETRDQGNSYIEGPDGKFTFTVAEIQQLCNPGPVCGNSIVETGETCDRGNQNGVAGSGCSATCQTVPIPQCMDGVDNDGDGKVDCDPGNADPGCFPDGRGGGGACDGNNNSEADTPAPPPPTPLPDTALTTDEGDAVLTGLAMLAVGALLMRLQAIDRAFGLMSRAGGALSYRFSEANTSKRTVAGTRKRFESRFSNK